MTAPAWGTRRRFLASLGGGVIAVGSGCSGTRNVPTYEEGEVNESGGDPRSAEEMAAAEALAPGGAKDAATPLDSLALEDHEFVVQDGYKGPTVRGTVANTGSELIEYAEIRVRAYDSSGAQIGRYLATTGDIEGETRWQFGVILLASASTIADYDIAVLGIPG